MSAVTQARLQAALATMAAHGAPVQPAMASAQFTAGLDTAAIADSLARLPRPKTKTKGRTQSGEGPTGTDQGWGLLGLFDDFLDALESLSKLGDGKPAESTAKACEEQQAHEQTVDHSQNSCVAGLECIDAANEACVSGVEKLARTFAAFVKAAAAVTGPFSPLTVITAAGATAAATVSTMINARNAAISLACDQIIADATPPAQRGNCDIPVCTDPTPSTGAEPQKVDDDC
ncbi:MAG TPA: hypothetical protein H9867_08585, partial [Candidatus Corynebacterium gallistercoris]|nr:hypothetical protein [Candidatus Corynebacterium gallistercoris]